MLTTLSVYRPAASTWKLATQTFATTADYRRSGPASKRLGPRLHAHAAAFEAFERRALPILEPPDYFGTEPPVAQLMTVPELRTHIADLRRRGSTGCRSAVELQRKIAFPFVTVVMSLLAVPFGVTTGRRGALYGIGIGIVIALAYWIICTSSSPSAAPACCPLSSPAGAPTSSSPAPPPTCS